MSKHNNNLKPSCSHKCFVCKKYITIGEENLYRSTLNYECATCFHERVSKPLTKEQYHKQFEI